MSRDRVSSLPEAAGVDVGVATETASRAMSDASDARTLRPRAGLSWQWSSSLETSVISLNAKTTVLNQSINQSIICYGPPLIRRSGAHHNNAPFTRYSMLSNRLSNRFDNRFDNRVERTATVRSTGCQTGLYNRVDNGLYTRYSRLSNRLSNGFDNRLNVCIHV